MVAGPGDSVGLVKCAGAAPEGTRVADASSDNPGVELAIDARRVSKTYRGRVRALDGVSLAVHRGEVFGLLGPNGAGKSTLVKILMTIVRTRRAEGAMLGAPIGDKGALARVGYLPEHLRFPDYLTAHQVLDFVGGMHAIPRRQRRRRGDELLETVGLRDWADKRVKQYSKGMKQRLGIAQALVNDPDLVVLDEPTDGVDPVGRRDIRAMLQRMRDERRTVLLNSHLLGEVEMVCDRVSILVQGTVRAEGTLDELAGGGARYELEVTGAPDEAERRLRAAFADRLDRDAPGGGVAMEAAGATLLVRTTDAAAAQPALDTARRAGLDVKSFRLVRPTLEDLFIQAVTDPTTGKALAPGADRSKRKGRGQ
jgi:ABC-2 type transport system ATP-binding protein